MLQHHPQIVHFLTSPIYLPENSFPLPLPSEKPDEEREGVKSALCQQFPYQERSFASGSPFSSDWLPDPPKHLASFTFFFVFKNAKFGASLVSQSWICLPMQETWVRSLIWEDPTYHSATKPVHRNYWACALEPRHCSYWSPRALGPMLGNKRSHRNEKPAHGNWRVAPEQHQRPSMAKK